MTAPAAPTSGAAPADDGHARFDAALRTHRLVAILRSATADGLGAAVRVLADAGVRCLEVTLPTPGSLAAVAEARTRFGDELVIGVGTVLRTAEVRRAADAGARFVVSPNLHPPVVETARELGLGALPGVFTPTEALAAMDAGATAAKLFPAVALGPGYVAALRAPLPDLPLVATGGVALADVRPWLAAGALAVAVGSPLLGDALDGGDLGALRRRAATFVAAARGGDSRG
ncbi:bifunctional 4-hydroxy-2-oxoglutarate aldolase/2-dehydro-3-deoxy-phosphogluconate aldolase [Kitasatospora xanthocidica]|uniref:bifunctional 4-hydroxy-2-oxoglutarate aldolase/2-dehydro-3-deoxy-phosphogluconate aldolase n=1 Tax=Kitasatospora xanthocidica TaxID=83382 RepID=UPI0036E69CCE